MMDVTKLVASWSRPEQRETNNAWPKTIFMQQKRPEYTNSNTPIIKNWPAKWLRVTIDFIRWYAKVGEVQRSKNHLKFTWKASKSVIWNIQKNAPEYKLVRV